MNKTLRANIGGRVFNIEDLAYEKLNAYIHAIRKYFGNKDTADEIVSDIELRLAELFAERLNASKEVITVADVEEVIEIMGRPEVFAEADSSEQYDQSHSYNAGTGKKIKRVFRDTDNSVIFGVCGGLSAYLGWDPIILRIAFAVAFFAFGVGLIPYIVLALIIPAAKTTAEKLQMRGEPVTVENISRKVSESFEDMKEEIKDFGKRNDINEARIRDGGERLGEGLKKFGSLLLSIVNLLAAILVRLIGVVLLIASLLALLVILAFIFGFDMNISIGQYELSDHYALEVLTHILFANQVHAQLFLWSVSALLLIPCLGIMIAGFRLLFDLKNEGKNYVGSLLTGLWIIAFIGLFYTAAKLGNEFKTEAMYKEPITEGALSTDLLVVTAESADVPAYRYKHLWWQSHRYFPQGVTITEGDSTDYIYQGRNMLTVRQNTDTDHIQIHLERRSRGSGHKAAVQHASGILPAHSMRGDTLHLPERFTLTEGTPMRMQEVRYEIYVPVGKRIQFNKGTAPLLRDVPNVTNTPDEEMEGKTWLMTQNGLICADCSENQSPDLQQRTK